MMKVRKWIAAGALTVGALGATAGGLVVTAGASAPSTTSSAAPLTVAAPTSSASLGGIEETLEGIICKIFPFLPFCGHHQISPPVSSPVN